MTVYRSLVGGFYSANPNDLSVKRSIRANNPWALNDSPWQHSYPGYVGTTQADNSPNANKTSIYEAPEYGVAAGWELLHKYAQGGYSTPRQILTRYGGTNQDYSEYLRNVIEWSGIGGDTPVDINNDQQLLRLAKAMFRWEAGKETPLSDAQILYGFKLGRQISSGQPIVVPFPAPAQPARPGFWASFLAFLEALFGRHPSPPAQLPRILRLGDTGPDVLHLQERLHALGYMDLVTDGDFGAVTQEAVRKFQTSRNLDPDGEVGPLTQAELEHDGGARPPLMPPAAKYGSPPPWYTLAEKDIGFHEIGNNQGIEKLISQAHTGQVGDPWCAIGVNAKLEEAGFRGTRSASARSFEHDPGFIKLAAPTLGAITTMWRGSPSSGLGHVFLYDAENAQGIRGIGYNEDDQVKRSFHERSRIVGYYWPANAPHDPTGRIVVNTAGQPASREV